MKCSFILILILLFAVEESHAQLVGRVTMDVEVGSSISVGEQKTRLWQSSINPFGVSYAYRDRYKYPSGRLGVAIKKSLSPLFAAGIRSGVEVHYREYNPEGDAIVYVVPLQLVAEVKAFKITEKMGAFVNFSTGYELNGGWKIERSDGAFIQKKGGPLLSLEIKMAKTAELSSFYYKFGLEYEENYWTHRYVPDLIRTPYGKVETIRLKTIKNQVFFALGVTF